MEDPNPCERAKKWLQSLQKIENMNKIDPREAPISLDSSNIYEGFVFRGLQIDQLQEGRALCTFKVPPRLVDGNGIWPARVIMSLVDNVCAAAIMTCDKPVKVSVDYNLSYFSTAKTHDEIEIDARVLGHKGGLSTVVVDMRNKITGQLVAQARQSMHNLGGLTVTPRSKM
ncbi:uncharacterized protein LOC131064186 isoform X1 [Cryptomeria japonica]|uniref:uncharacterized protein LOC131064186 isoform X1 n=1 Tax=Cryptomeria japonica TaxID=3369 RepID=UPI0025AD377B|nr:uncharacterized protein LOC131064186 isoform X1 [Cryptomeria japonica]